MKNYIPVRLLKNKFSDEINMLEQTLNGDEQKSKMIELLGHGRAKKGMLEGDIIEGELEVGQIVNLIKDLPTCNELMTTLINDYQDALNKLQTF